MKYLLTLFCFSCALFAEDKTTMHLIQLERGPLVYRATVGSLPTHDKEEKISGEIGYIAYIKEGDQSDRQRPLTFAFNGGPGSSSIWLHAAAFGPRRILSPEEGQQVVPPYTMLDNLETILDLTDLVFVDPMGTGFSRAISPEQAKNFYGTASDIQSIGDFIRDYLTANNRWNSPKYIAGESYGALRACGLADYLHDFHSIYLNGLILISPAIDYQTFLFNADNPLPHFLFMPTYATTPWYHKRLFLGRSIEEVAEAAREFAYEVYAPLLLKGHALASDQLYRQLAEFTGLSVDMVRRNKGRINSNDFQVEFMEGKALGMYDTRLLGDYSNRIQLEFSQDPSATNISGIIVGAFHDYLQNELSYPASYRSISLDVNRQWDYSSHPLTGYPNLMNALRQSLVINPSLKVFTACGYFDCVTPFAAAEYCINHLHLPDSYRANCQLAYYDGGHMFYLNPSARIKFKNDLVEFFQ